MNNILAVYLQHAGSGEVQDDEVPSTSNNTTVQTNESQHQMKKDPKQPKATKIGTEI